MGALNVHDIFDRVAEGFESESRMWTEQTKSDRNQKEHDVANEELRSGFEFIMEIDIADQYGLAELPDSFNKRTEVVQSLASSNIAIMIWYERGDQQRAYQLSSWLY